MSLRKRDLRRADRGFLNLPGDSEPTIYYATIRRFIDPEKIFSFWKVFDALDEAVRLQSDMVNRLGPELAAEISLDYHPHLSLRGYVLVTGQSDYTLLQWYKKVCQIFADGNYLESEWLDFISSPLLWIIRIVARFLGRANGLLHHGNLVNGFSFSMDEDGNVLQLLLHNRREAGSYGDDVATFCKIIAVIANHLDHSYLSCQTNLEAIPADAFSTIGDKALKAYVKRIRTVSMRIDTAAQPPDVYLFAFEDPMIWTSEEEFHFFRKYYFYVFNVMTTKEQTKFLSYLEFIEPKLLREDVPGNIVDDRVQGVYSYRWSNYSLHGRIVKLPRNCVAHLNEEGESLQMDSIPKEIDIHTLALRELDAAAAASNIPELEHGLINYAFRGVLSFMEDMTQTPTSTPVSYDAVLVFVEGVEFRRGFEGFDTNPYT